MTTARPRLRDLLGPLAVVLLLAAPARAVDRWWSDAVEAQLGRAGDNAAELRAALDDVPTGQRESMAFLVEHMPPQDLHGLSASFLLENVALAHEAFEAAPWKDRISRELFLNDVLPYANISEARDPWRADFVARFRARAHACASPGAAARVLNETIFGELGVKYSTQRRRADQSPRESIEQGLASCTGLSIVLVNACRAVGVPARLAGIPSWPDKRGNHTWVEVWDDGWHFVGAAEPDPNGLDRAWFAGDAAKARRHVPEHAIYAVSYAPTGTVFPMQFDEHADPVSAVNVTDRYAPAAAAVATTADDAAPAPCRVFVRVHEPGGERAEAQVTFTPSGAVRPTHRGTAKAGTADMNDMLEFAIERGASGTIRAEERGRTVVFPLAVDGMDAHTIDLELPRLATGEAKIHAALIAAFAALAQGAEPAIGAELDALAARDPERARTLAWWAYRAAPIHDELRAEMDASVVRAGGYESPYVARTVGIRPAGGWGLVIAMHGGGGAPQEVNDQQWGVMQKYYRDHPEAGGYVYLALRAPTNEWNGFYTDYVYPLIDRLVRQFTVLGDVDPDRVYAMGYSHGGYGAFAIGPKMPDRFAAVHASAAAPTDGQTSARTLRTTPFTYMIGENDTAHGRIGRCRRFDELVKSIRGDRTDIYPVTMEYRAGFGHGGLPDRDWLVEMLPHVRNAAPREVSWEMTDGVIRDFFWLQCDAPGNGRAIEGRIADGRIVLDTEGPVGAFSLVLDERLVTPGAEIEVVRNGTARTVRAVPSMRNLVSSMFRRGDPRRAGTIRIEMDATP